MTLRKSILYQFCLTAAALLYSLIVGSRMADVVPSHWNAAGHIDGYGSKWMILLMMPGVMLLVVLLSAALPKLSPEKFRIEPFEATYSLIMLIVSGLMFTLHFVIVQSSSGGHWDIGRIIMGVDFVFFALLGNFLGKLQPNFFMGIRTPWTLADERVWRTTHRQAARLWVGGGVIGLLLVLAGLPFWLTFSYFMLMASAPAVQSYFVYRNLHPR